jgi:hypothetical protein
MGKQSARRDVASALQCRVDYGQTVRGAPTSDRSLRPQSSTSAQRNKLTNFEKANFVKPGCQIYASKLCETRMSHL